MGTENFGTERLFQCFRENNETRTERFDNAFLLRKLFAFRTGYGTEWNILFASVLSKIADIPFDVLGTEAKFFLADIALNLIELRLGSWTEGELLALPIFTR